MFQERIKNCLFQQFDTKQKEWIDRYGIWKKCDELIESSRTSGTNNNKSHCNEAGNASASPKMTVRPMGRIGGGVRATAVAWWWSWVGTGTASNLVRSFCRYTKSDLQEKPKRRRLQDPGMRRQRTLTYDTRKFTKTGELVGNGGWWRGWNFVVD